jgi:50S ribosomal protein L16 3-hydroxylase
MKKSALLGNLTPDVFMRQYWHKKPLLVRQAIPDFSPLLPKEALLDMAAKDDVESRLIRVARGKWTMRNGPFDKLPSVRTPEWTMLVQGVNLHDDAADALLRKFSFIGESRLDDLMISYATEGGGVGPHFDSYDVFLLQAQGQRRWRISAQKDLSLQEGMPLKILRNFQPEQEFVLDPGDMLYLPPHYAHEGVALGECMTYSIGFRAPAYQELAEGFFQFMAEQIEQPGRYRDPARRPARHPAQLDKDLLDKTAAMLRKVSFSKKDIALFLGEHLSEPKPNVFFDPLEKPLRPGRFRKDACQRGLHLARKSRMLYLGEHVFINGQSFIASKTDRPALQRLADRRILTGAEVSEASDDVLAAFHDWHVQGWLRLR